MEHEPKAMVMTALVCLGALFDVGLLGFHAQTGVLLRDAMKRKGPVACGASRNLRIPA